MAEISGNTNTILEVEEKTDLDEPELYLVILHNDHYTTMEFVVDVLRGVFHKPLKEATKIMLDVHRKGRGKVGTYAYDIARTKVAQVLTMARKEEFPLKCTMEKA